MNGKLVLASVFVGFFGLLTYVSANNTHKSAPTVLASTTDNTASTFSTEQTPFPDNPLRNVPLPNDGQTAIGTLGEGLIKKTNDEHQAPIASITKVITALVLLDKEPLEKGKKGEAVVFTEKDVQYFEEYFAKLGTVTAVEVGAQMSYYEGLQAMLLPSSNNMADTLVDHFFGSREDYLNYANNFLKNHGLNDTVVADASGFSPDSKSTPSDLITLGQLALRHPVIAEIVAQKTATLSVAGDVNNYNQLINEPDVIGIKPGTTDEAGYCLLFAAKLPDSKGDLHTVIIATIGHKDRPRFLETLHELLQSTRDAYANE